MVVVAGSYLAWHHGFVGLDSRFRGNDGERRGEWRSGVGVVTQRGVARPLPLWIADQARNDVTMRCIVLWIPAYAGMTVKGAGNDGPGWMCVLGWLVWLVVYVGLV